MSIVKMDKIEVVGLSSEKEAVMTSLMNLGAVEISEKQSENSLSNIDNKLQTNKEETDISVQDGTQEIRSLMVLMKRAIDISENHIHEKKPMFSSRRKISGSQFKQTVERIDEIRQKAEHLQEITSQVSNLRALIIRNRIIHEQLKPWRDFGIHLNKLKTRSTDIYLGTIANLIEYNHLEQALSENAPESITEIVFTGKDSLGLMVIGWRDREDEITQILKETKFVPLSVSDNNGTPEALAMKYSEEINKAQQQIEDITEDCLEIAKEKESFEIIHDYAMISLSKELSVNLLTQTEYTFMLEGWTPSDLTESITKALQKEYCIALSSRKVTKEDDYPILLKNHPLIKPYEVVTSMFSTPSSKDVDPTPLMAPFFLFFFSLMLSDAGYGLLLAGGCAFLLWKIKVVGNTRSMALFLFQGGIASVIWGLMFGGFFGDIITVLTVGKYSFPTLWFDPFADPTKLMIWSMIFGTVHLLVGMGAKGMILIMTGKVKDAIFDIFSWYLVILGAGALIAGMTMNIPIVSDVGKYTLLVGVGIIALFGGRATKNPILRIFKGLSELYSITGYFSDILSYTRILALALATSVIAMVVNLLGGIAGFNFVGILIFVMVGLVGHLMNLAISSLGCYVHTSRLQYVEFFSKFYEGGGREWNPLEIKTEYIQILHNK